jgi:hypothetical protein
MIIILTIYWTDVPLGGKTLVMALAFVFAAAAVLLDFSQPVPESSWQILKIELARTEIATLPQESTLWAKREQFYQDMQAGEIFQVRLNGDCGAGMEAAEHPVPGPLGWVYLVDGQILPFVFIDCDRIARALWPELRGRTPAERRQKMARAISRVVSHELTHIITQNPNHLPAGAQKGHLTPDELLEAWPRATLEVAHGRNKSVTSPASGHPARERQAYTPLRP